MGFCLAVTKIMSNFAVDFGSTASDLTLGIAQTSLALHSLNRSLVSRLWEGPTTKCSIPRQNHHLERKKEQNYITFWSTRLARAFHSDIRLVVSLVWVWMRFALFYLYYNKVSTDFAKWMKKINILLTLIL